MSDHRNVIPGANAVGYGFNILGSYSVDSITSQLFIHHTMQDQTYTYDPTQIEYNVPDNIDVIAQTASQGSASVFDTMQEWQTYLSAKANVSLSEDAGAFAAEVEASYSSVSSGTASQYLGLFDASFQNWQLQLRDESATWVSPTFASDPVVLAVPETFSTEVQDSFFAVFRTYGTHYVTNVTVGGNINYRAGVDKSFTSDEEEVKANLTAEYNAVFVEAKAKAEAAWKSLGKRWVNSRVVSVSAAGGDSSILDALDPGFGDRHDDAFMTWCAAVEKNPAVVDFTLRPISLLFPAEKRTAVTQAIEAYVNGAIWASARMDYTPGSGPKNGTKTSDYTTTSTIIVQGTALTPSYDPPPPPPFIAGRGKHATLEPVGGLEVEVLHPDTLAQLASGVHYVPDPTNTEQVADLYAAIVRDYTTGTLPAGYWLVIAAFGMSGHNVPQGDFASWLESCGAALKQWRAVSTMSTLDGFCCYLLIGKQGLSPGKALERFAVENSEPTLSPNVEGLVSVYSWT